MNRSAQITEYFSKTDHHRLAALLVGQGEPLSFGDSEIASLIHDARAHRVHRMLAWSLRQRETSFENSAWRALLAPDYNGVRDYLVFKSCFQDIARALAKENLPVVWLKGWTLAHSVYPDPLLRPMRDLDLFVPSQMRERAKLCLTSLGYFADEHPQIKVVSEMQHHEALHGRVTVEVHTKLIGMRSKLFGKAQADWFWQHTRVLSTSDFQWTGFAPEAELLYLCAHAMLQHGENDFLLQRYLDLHLLLQTYTQLDWEMIIAQAVAFRWSYAVARALEITRDHFGAPVPESVCAELHARRRADEDPRNTRWIAPDSTRGEIVQGWLRGMRARDKLIWALATLFPPPAFVQWRYHVLSAWQIPFFYFYRWFALTRNVLQTMLKCSKSKIQARGSQGGRR